MNKSHDLLKALAATLAEHCGTDAFDVEECDIAGNRIGVARARALFRRHEPVKLKAWRLLPGGRESKVGGEITVSLTRTC